ncbi:hypothetical protein HYFRA_00003618 [Hymenoscyphus fraxineus]|uniref:Ankyrin n=1 Tax=Hymenoscyphus fraxineus TaxID=746836 RepID=A0A9N9L0V4_9HELO|nr:hypothetical protein HYFRA_00003618 [Hymenoscyphus fraxineus]
MEPQISLDSLRRVPDPAQCVQYAMNGNIEGLKELFQRGLASPWDYKTARFLTLAGSDVDYRPIAKTDNSTRHNAFDNLLHGGLDKEAEEELRCPSAGSDWIDEQQSTRLHKVIIGLLPLPLEQLLAEVPGAAGMTDAMGRTPLLWAAARGDHMSLKILLDHHADPKIMDIYLAPPVSYVADRGHTLCDKFLLEAGAKAEPVLSPGIKLGSCAARNTIDPALLKYLLTYGAQVDSTGIDGNTALTHPARTNNFRLAILLLNYCADINASSIT